MGHAGTSHSPVVKNPPFKAGNAGSIPGPGTKIHKVQSATKYKAHVLWSLHTTAREPSHPGACMPQLEKRKPTRHI